MKNNKNKNNNKKKTQTQQEHKKQTIKQMKGKNRKTSIAL